METFRSTFPIEKAPFGLSHDNRILLLGSCFTENMGARLAALKFYASINPFGIVYNPLSISRCLERLLDGDQPFSAAELAQHAGLWHGWEHHGSLSDPDQGRLIERLNTLYFGAVDFLRGADRLIVTPGTADVFFLQAEGRPVANCHKAPAAIFRERRLGVEETVSALQAVFERLHRRLPDLRIILSVSPIRHLRKGPVANQRSKAALLLACAELCERLPYVQYFPAYELLLDDLRDYRFYERDLTHPSGLAQDYIWEKFTETYFSPATLQLADRLRQLRAAVEHRPFRPDSAEHRQFARKQLELIASLEMTAPALDFSIEKAHFQQIIG
ncbi:MAG: GSCFA domain-containing protein [Saprospiraceae bacterium]